jgi:hypothetical protein
LLRYWREGHLHGRDRQLFREVFHGAVVLALQPSVESCPLQGPACRRQSPAMRCSE